MPGYTEGVEVGQTTAMSGENCDKTRLCGTMMADFGKSVIWNRVRGFRGNKIIRAYSTGSICVNHIDL